MDWAEIRRQARATIHEHFGREVEYVGPTGGASQRTSARIHTQNVLVGDLDREGYPRIMEDVDRVIFLTSEVQRLGIRRGGTVTLPAGLSYRLEIREPARDDFTVEFQVKRVDP
jgi:hypothetical protein